MGHPARFTKTDLKRAVEAVKEAGERVGRIEVDPSGKIVIYPIGTAPKPTAGNSWDDVLG
jgi:hypothetical protein